METNEKQCVCQMSEDYFEASENVKSAHTSTKRIYWAILFILILFTMNIVGLYNHHFSVSAVNSRKDYQDKRDIEVQASELAKKNGIVDSAQYKLAIDSLEGVYKKNREELKGKDKMNYLVTLDIEEKAYFEKNMELGYTHPYFIGNSFSVEDMFQIMTLVYLFAFSWLYYCIRADNLCVGKILNKLYVKGNQKVYRNLKRFVYYSIVYNNIIFPSTRRREPYAAIENTDKDLKGKINNFITTHKRYRDIFNELLFTGSILIIAVNFIIFIMASYYYYGEWCKWLASLEAMEIIILIICLVGICFIIRNLCRIYKTTRATNQLLRDFKRKLKHDEELTYVIENHKLTDVQKTIIVVKRSKKELLNNDLRKEFIDEYSIEKGYYICCNTSYEDEKVRLLRLLLENKDNIFGENYIKPNIEKAEEELHISNNNKKEYFIFLKVEESRKQKPPTTPS